VGRAPLAHAPQPSFSPESASKWAIARGRCRLGTIRRAYSKVVKRGRVTSENPEPRMVLPRAAKVNLVVSRGGRG
jgi:beta-lactam-binding protein with PASTA domain